MPRPLRVLLAISSLRRGGAERQLVELVARMDRARYDPMLAVCDPTDEFGISLDASRVFSLDSPRGASALTLARLVGLVKTLRPDVVHSFGGMLNLHARIAARASGGVTVAVTSVRAGIPTARDIAHERLSLAPPAARIVNSVGIRDELVARAGLATETLDVIENGVNTLDFVSLDGPRRAALRERFGIRETTLVLPARRSAEKNHLGVIDALNSMARQGRLPPGLRVLFVGRAAEASIEREIARRIERGGISSRVELRGPEARMCELLNAADGTLLPSHFEGMPNVVLESLSCGTPALVSDGANRDRIVREGLHGVELQGRSYTHIAEGISRFMRYSPEERDAMGARGRALMVSRFTLNRMVDRTLAVYDRVTREKG